MFRDAFARRRALIAASALYEWRPVEGEKIKQPLAIVRQDSEPLPLAGIWEGWRCEGGDRDDAQARQAVVAHARQHDDENATGAIAALRNVGSTAGRQKFSGGSVEIRV